MKSQILSKSLSLNELESFAKELIEVLPNSAVVVLNGNLAAGKTTLVAKIANILGVKSATSPTFSLQQIYGDRVFHYDFYRVDFEEIVNLGLLEEFEKEGLHFVEWANSDLQELLIEAGFRVYSIDINVVDESLREYILKVLNA